MRMCMRVPDEGICVCVWIIVPYEVAIVFQTVFSQIFHI